MGGLVTDRDVEWLDWVGRWRAVTAGQVARRFVPELPTGTKVVERRARVWRELGLVESARILAGVATVHTLRGPGMAMVGVKGPIRRPVVGQLRHDLAVVDLAVWLQRDASVRLITEREIRAADAPDTPRPRFAVHAAPGSGRRLVFPDLLSVEDGAEGRRVVAREVELSGKDVPRLTSLMRSYVDDPRVSGAVYYVPEHLLARVSRAAAVANERAGRAFVEVTGWDWTRLDSVGADAPTAAGSQDLVVGERSQVGDVSAADEPAPETRGDHG